MWAVGEAYGVFANQGGIVGSLRFSPDGRLLLATFGFTGCDNTQRVFEVISRNKLTAYAKHNNTDIASAFSPDGQLVATGGGLLGWRPLRPQLPISRKNFCVLSVRFVRAKFTALD